MLTATNSLRCIGVALLSLCVACAGTFIVSGVLQPDFPGGGVEAPGADWYLFHLQFYRVMVLTWILIAPLWVTIALAVTSPFGKPKCRLAALGATPVLWAFFGSPRLLWLLGVSLVVQGWLVAALWGGHRDEEGRGGPEAPHEGTAGHGGSLREGRRPSHVAIRLKQILGIGAGVAVYLGLFGALSSLGFSLLSVSSSRLALVSPGERHGLVVLEHACWLLIVPLAAACVAWIARRARLGRSPAVALFVSLVIWTKHSVGSSALEILVSLVIQGLVYARVVGKPVPGTRSVQFLISSSAWVRRSVVFAGGACGTIAVYEYTRRILMDSARHYLLSPSTPASSELMDPAWTVRLHHLDYLTWLVWLPLAAIIVSWICRRVRLSCWIPMLSGAAYTGVQWSRMALNSWWQELLPSLLLQVLIFLLIGSAGRRTPREAAVDD